MIKYKLLPLDNVNEDTRFSYYRCSNTNDIVVTCIGCCVGITKAMCETIFDDVEYIKEGLPAWRLFKLRIRLVKVS
jgi:hypothetical protein